MSKHLAFEMQKFTKPRRTRFFYACARWAAIVFLLAAIGSLLAGCDNSTAASRAEADRQDDQALSSREWAGQQVCGPTATAVWHGDTLECLRTRPVMVTQ